MKNNSIQFAVVREDPALEAALIHHFKIQRILTVASGGCTALCLQAEFPRLDITLYDLNPNQLSLIESKIAALGLNKDEKTLNIGEDLPQGFNQCGNFESLFRALRLFIWEFIAAKTQWQTWFNDACARQKAMPEVFHHPYWSVAFELFFSDVMLNTMFSPDATQHAPRGSYPKYFQNAIEKGLMRHDATDNYFLHHILLGYYLHRPEAQPKYLTHRDRQFSFSFFQGRIQDIQDLSSFQMIGFSNIFDWCHDDEVHAILQHVIDNVQPGTVLIWRQLNNDKDYLTDFNDKLSSDPQLAEQLLKHDRSLFYSKLCIAQRK